MLHTYHEIILMEWAEFSRNWVDFCIDWNWLDLIGTWSRKWVITQELNCTWEWSPSRASVPTNSLRTRLYLASPVSCILSLWTVWFTHVHMTWKTCTNLPSCGIGWIPPSNSIPCLSDTDCKFTSAFTLPIVILQNHSKSTKIQFQCPIVQEVLIIQLASFKSSGSTVISFSSCSSLLCLTLLEIFPFIVCSWTPPPASSLCLPDTIHVMNAPSPFPFVTLLLQCVTVNMN